MTKLEKVIKGLECCTKTIVTHEARCTDCPYNDGNSKHCVEQTQRDALELLKKQNPVVLCKDCKHYKVEDGQCPADNTSDSYYSWTPDPNWFCADGERKEDDEQQT